MNDACVEACAAKRDCSAFEPRKELALDSMPRFPLREVSAMTREEKLTSIAIYLAKVVDQLIRNGQ